jgi:hypothetical protein
MKLGLKALVIALVMALAAVPAAFAKNGGNAGHGKPSWAGQGKPSWAGSGHANGKAPREKKAKKSKHHGADAAADEESGDEVDLDGLNPAWYCKTLSDEVTKLAQDFASMFGTNPNGANAFGKCVSRRAHGEDLSDALGGDAEQENCETAEPPATDGTDTDAEGSGTDTTASEDEATSEDEDVADDEAAEDAESSDDEAAGPEECESADSASDEPAGDEQHQGDDEQGEDDQGQDEGNASDEVDSSDLAAALRFLRL